MRFTGIVIGGMAAWCAASAVAAVNPPANGAAKTAAAKPAQGAAGPAAGPEQIDFFETSVRPVLAEKCYFCHGPKMQQAGLRLDSAAEVLKKRDGGKAGVVPGQPDQSAVIQAVRYTGAVKMPPQGKLAD